MEILKPTKQETEQINSQRAQQAAVMASSGRANAKQTAMPGPCSPDMNRLANGELAAVHHVKRLAVIGKSATSSLTVVRYVAEKPRTNTGFTGLIHEVGGAKAYVEGARQLHQAGVPFASEVISDAGMVIAAPHLTTGWVGAREVSGTAPRYAVRPTEQERDAGVHPLPTWVKNEQGGGLAHTVNAVRTIMSDKPQARTRFGYDGMEEVVTLGNPHVGVVLRGQSPRPAGETSDILAEEIGTTRDVLDAEFGKDRVPVVLDISHDHAKYEGGGEAGQLAIAGALGDLMITGARVDGWMAETYIYPGKQPADGIEPGLSITDPCIGQQNAEDLLLRMDGAWAMTYSESIHV